MKLKELLTVRARFDNWHRSMLLKTGQQCEPQYATLLLWLKANEPQMLAKSRVIWHLPANPPNARFWHWHGPSGAWVRITIRPGQTLHWSCFRHTDEGWASEQHTFSHCGDHVESSVVYDGVDCDGRLSSFGEYTCPLDSLEAVESILDPESKISRPDWERVDHEQRDYQAEMAGY